MRLVLEDIDPAAVERLGTFARMASERLGARATVVTTTDQRALGKPHTVVRPVVAGVNHFPVVCKLDVDGTDGLELLQRMVDDLGGLDGITTNTKRPEPFSELDFATRNALKLALLDRYGALPAAGDRHVAEFVPSVLTEASGWGAAWGIALTSIERRQEHQAQYIANVDRVLAGEVPLTTSESGEMVAPVIDALLTGAQRELPLNVPNAGQCPDVTDGRVVESMCLVDSEGIRGRDQAPLPAALAELFRRHVAVHELTITAALSGDRAQAKAAFALDPLAGRGDLLDTEVMVDELLAGTARWLPQFCV